MNSTATQCLLITPGEPAGIGPDLCIQLAQQPSSAERIVIADPLVLENRAKQLGLALKLNEFQAHKPGRAQHHGELSILPVATAVPVEAGKLDPDNAPYVLQTLQAAVEAIQQGHANALITGPVHKGVINQAGFSFTGHTEYLAALTGTEKVVMMLATPGLRVALATTHLPLRDVCAAITAENLEQVIRILHQDLSTRFGIKQPRILVCGLNPHAGEEGYLGREEIDIMQPLLAKLRDQGLQLRGPVPADTAFTPKYLEESDAVLAMYHDQGLPVLKYKGFGQAVNITLGLPFTRTSVDHGTALELAGSGRTHIGSMEYAIQVAQQMASTTR